MMGDPSVYDLLATQQAADTTVSQLNQSLKSTYIQSKNVEFWSGVITVARALSESRTNAHGIIIPESGAVWSQAIANGATADLIPSNASEVWRIENLSLAGGTAALFDGTTQSQIDFEHNPGQGTHSARNGPYFISKTLYLRITNGTGGEITPAIAYSKVSL